MLQPAGQLSDQDLIDLRVFEHVAFDAMTAWHARPAHLRALLVSAAVARELLRLGYGADNDENGQSLAAADAALAAAKRLQGCCVGFATQEAKCAVRWLLMFHDAQREAASRADYHRCLAQVRREPSRYGIGAAA
jgi:hypothetical protein